MYDFERTVMMNLQSKSFPATPNYVFVTWDHQFRQCIWGIVTKPF